MVIVNLKHCLKKSLIVEEISVTGIEFAVHVRVIVKLTLTLRPVVHVIITEKAIGFYSHQAVCPIVNRINSFSSLNP